MSRSDRGVVRLDETTINCPTIGAGVPPTIQNSTFIIQNYHIALQRNATTISHFSFLISNYINYPSADFVVTFPHKGRR